VLKGANIHEIISLYYKNNLDTSFLFDLNIKELEELVKNFLSFEIKRKENNDQVLVVEKTFEIKLYLEELELNEESYNFLKKIGNNLVVNGRIDLLLKSKDSNEFFIIDFKTGNSKEDLFYSWLLYRALDIIANIKTINLTNNQIFEIKINKEILGNYERKIIKKLSYCINKLYFSITKNKWNKNNNFCNLCSFKDFCR